MADETVSPWWWWLLAVAVAGTLALVVFRFVGTLVLGLFVYYAARPMAARLRRHVSDGAAAAVALFAVIAPFLLVAGAVVLVALGRLSAVRPEDFQAILDVLVRGLDVSALPPSVADLLRTYGLEGSWPAPGEFVDVALGVLGTSANGAFHLVLSLTAAYFLLRDDRRLAAWVHATLAPRESTAGRYLDAVDDDLQTIYYGNLLAIGVAILLSVALYLLLNQVAPPGLAIPEPILLGAATGLATIVPLLGRGVVYGAILAYLLVQSWGLGTETLWFPGLFYALTFFGVDPVMNYGVLPYVAGRTIHTGLMLFAYVLGAVLFGWYGIFLGPLLLAVSANFVRLVLPRLVAERPGRGMFPGGGDDE